MVAYLVMAMASIIVLIDVREHRIRNSHILIFAIPLSISSSRISLAEIFFIALTAFIVCLLFGVGGGDFKLFSILVATQGSLVASFAYFSLFLLSTSFALLISVSLQGGLRGSIPLAPAILAPFLYLYLGI